MTYSSRMARLVGMISSWCVSAELLSLQGTGMQQTLPCTKPLMCLFSNLIPISEMRKRKLTEPSLLHQLLCPHLHKEATTLLSSVGQGLALGALSSL